MRTIVRRTQLATAEPQHLDIFCWCLIGLAIFPLVAAATYVLVHFGGSFHGHDDNALNELTVRQIGERLPLLGPFSRSGWSHPGPMFFYLMWVPYRAFGSNSSAMVVGALLFNALAIGASVALAHRWGGRALGLLTALGFAWLVVRLPGGFLEDPWNPFVTALPFGLFLLLAWAAINGDGFALPFAGVVGSFCAQTHIEYLAVVFLVLAGVAVAVLLRIRQQPGLRGIAKSARPLLWLVAVLGILWLPPLLEQLIHSPGNVRNTFNYLAHGEPTKTFADGLRAVMAQFTWHPDWVVGIQPLTAVTQEPVALSAPQLPILLLPFACALLVSWLRRWTAIRNLATLLLCVLVLAVVVLTRTTGPMYEYRLRWIWVLATLVVVSTIWALVHALLRGYPMPRLVTAAGSALLVALSALGVSTLLAADPPAFEAATTTSRLVAQLERRLPRGPGELEITGTSFAAYGDIPALMLGLGRVGYPTRVPATADNRLRYGPMGLTTDAAARRLVIVANEGIEATERSPFVREVAFVSAASRSVRARALQHLNALIRSGPVVGRRLTAYRRLTTILAGRAVFLILPFNLRVPLGAGSSVPKGEPIPKSALIYGDGLTYESRFDIQERFARQPGWKVHVHSFGYLAPCDWLLSLPTDLAADHPSIVGVLTAGDTGVTQCMKDATGTPIRFGSLEYYAKYRADLETLFEKVTSTQARLVFFAPPPFANRSRQDVAERITAIAADLATHYDGVSISTGVTSSLSEHHRFADRKRCLPSETNQMGCGSDGRIRIRTDLRYLDSGLHLCPVGLKPGRFGVCSVYASGEVRFARAMASVLVDTSLSSH